MRYRGSLEELRLTEASKQPIWQTSVLVQKQCLVAHVLSKTNASSKGAADSFEISIGERKAADRFGLHGANGQINGVRNQSGGRNRR